MLSFTVLIYMPSTAVQYRVSTVKKSNVQYSTCTVNLYSPDPDPDVGLEKIQGSSVLFYPDKEVVFYYTELIAFCLCRGLTGNFACSKCVFMCSVCSCLCVFMSVCVCVCGCLCLQYRRLTVTKVKILSIIHLKCNYQLTRPFTLEISYKAQYDGTHWFLNGRAELYSVVISQYIYYIQG